MARLSVMGKQSSSISSTSVSLVGSAKAVSLNGFFEAATDYLQLENENSLLNLETNLQLISVGIISYTDEAECFKYFNFLLQLMDSNLPIGILYKVLKSACDNEDGLQQLRNNWNMLQRLCNNVPKVGDLPEFQEWSVQKVQETLLLLNILEKITKGFCFSMFDISVRQLLERLSCLFMALCDKESKKDIPCHALAIMVNVCRTHQSSLSVSEFRAIKGKNFIAKLLTFTTQEAFNASAAGEEDFKDKMDKPTYSPLQVIHLMLMLEGVAGPLPDKCLYQRMEWSFKALAEAIRKKNCVITQQAAEFLTDLISMEQRRNFLQRMTSYDSKIESIVDAILESGHMTSICDITVVKLLSALLSFVPDQLSKTNKMSQMRNILVLCTTYFTELSNMLMDELDVGVEQVELVTEVMSLASYVLSHIPDTEDLKEDFTELVQCPAHVIAGSLKDLEIDVLPEDLKCFTASIKLLTQICKFSDFSSKVQDLVSEETIDTLNKAFELAPQGNLSICLIAYLEMLSSKAEWEENLKQLLSVKSICEHVAFVIKCTSSSSTDIIDVVYILSVMNEKSARMVKEAVKQLDIPDFKVSQTKNNLMFAERDSAVLDDTLNKLRFNNDSFHTLASSDSSGGAMIGMVEAIHLQNIDLRAQIAQLQNCLECTNKVARDRHHLLDKAYNERAQVYARMLQAEKRCHSKDVLLHSVQKRLKTAEDCNLKIKQDFDIMFLNNKEEQNKVEELTKELKEKNAALKEAQNAHEVAKNCMQQLETEKTDLNEKLARYKKDCTAFNHKNGTLTKECESLKADNKDMTKKIEEMGRELLELKRVQEMVAKLTTGGKF